MYRSRSEFIARMSHEIRTSLNAMIGMSEALFYKVDSDDKRKLAKSAVSSGKLLLSLLNDILELSRAESDKLKITREKVDMNSFLEDIEVHYQ
ncbi:MAG: HAMP domain-containing histidine kinase [Bacteroidales bacterium]|nr:HAMP domain-containing histidine kinase [Bacteroidales bacterium]